MDRSSIGATPETTVSWNPGGVVRVALGSARAGGDEGHMMTATPEGSGVLERALGRRPPSAAGAWPARLRESITGPCAAP